MSSAPQPKLFGRSRVAAAALVAGLAAVLLAGCRNDEIRHYQVPKLDLPEAPAAAGQKAAQRLLAAIVPHGERTWFFKLVGPPEAIEEQRSAFDKFLQSVHFTDGAARPVTWTVPEGWREEPGNELRYATFHLGPKDAPCELTVVPLGREAGSMLANVNRWRGQLGLGNLTEADVGKVSKEIKVADSPATFVEMTGKAGAGPKMPPFASGKLPPMMSPAPTATGPTPGLKYTVPEGWTKLPDSGMRAAAFGVADQEHVAEVTVIPLGGPAGGVLENVNRWRGQIRLGPTTEEQLRREMRQIEVDGKPAQYVELTGPESAGAQRESILAVIVARPERTWFIKMKGPAGLVGKQKANFEAFAKSVKFEGATGANHG